MTPTPSVSPTPSRRPRRRLLAETLESRLLFSAAPTAVISLPAGATTNVLLGSTNNATITFHNGDTTTGFGPIVAVAVKNGITPTDATYLGASLAQSQSPQNFDSSGNVTFTDDKGEVTTLNSSDFGGGFNSNDTVYFYKLPLGSFPQSEPDATINLAYKLSADAAANGTPGPSIGTVGLFQYGTSATGNGTLVGAASDLTLTPTLITMTDTFSGHEDETATGPDNPQSFTIDATTASLLGNLVSGDAASDSQLKDLTLFDTVSNEVGLNGQNTVTLVSAAGATLATLTEGASGANTYSLQTVVNTDGSETLAFHLNNPVNADGEHVKIEVGIYVPEFVYGESGGARVETATPILPSSGAPEAVTDPNTAFAAVAWTGNHNTSGETVAINANWLPGNTSAYDTTFDDIPTIGNVGTKLDPTAAATQFFYPGSAPGTVDFFTAKSIAVQEGIADGAPAPGNNDAVTINFQLSDYFSFNDLVLDGQLSDALHFDGVTPTLTIHDTTNGTTFTGQTLAGNFTGSTTPAGDGTTPLQFDVSGGIEAALGGSANGILLGGLVDGADGSIADDSTGASFTQTVTADTAYGTFGSISFHATIQQTYLNPASYAGTVSGANNYLLAGDGVSASIRSDNSTTGGNVLDIVGGVTSMAGALGANFTVNTAHRSDDTNPSLTLPQNTVVKSIDDIYDPTAGTDIPVTSSITPDDIVTYKIVFTLPSGNVDALDLQDYLPEPIFDLTGVTFASTTNATTLHQNQGEYTFTVANGTGGVLTLTPTVSSNSIDFSISDITAGSAGNTITILFSVKATQTALADNLFLTNVVQATNNNSSGTANPIAQSIVQTHIGEPKVQIYKGAFDSSAFTDTGSTYDGLTFDSSGNLTGANVTNTTSLANVNLSAKDGPQDGDSVTYFLVVQNAGGAGAYNINFEDVLNQASYDLTGVTAGSFSAYTATGGALTPASLTYSGSTLNVSLGTLASHDAVIIVYHLTVNSSASVSAGEQITNSAAVTQYENVNQTTNYVGSVVSGTPNAGDKTLAAAMVTILPPKIDKSLDRVVVDGTAAYTGAGDNNAVTTAEIGDVATYTITITFPRDAANGITITDTLDAGLSFLQYDSITVSGATNWTGSVAFTSTAASGAGYTLGSASGGTNNQLTFVLGNVSGANTITITYDARVMDVASNTAGVQLANTASLAYTATVDNPGLIAGTATTTTGATATPATAPAKVTVVEPVLTVTKAVSDATPVLGETITYTITLSNSNGANSATAYHVLLDDVVPTQLGLFAFVTGFQDQLNGTGTTQITASAFSGNTLTGEFNIGVGGSVVIKYTAVVGGDSTHSAANPNVAAYDATGATHPDNTASTTYNSQATGSNGRNGLGTGTGGHGTFDNYAKSGHVAITVVNPDLTISKDDTLTTIVIGTTTQVSYTITVTNQGTAATSTDFYVVDPISSFALFTAGTGSSSMDLVLDAGQSSAGVTQDTTNGLVYWHYTGAALTTSGAGASTTFTLVFTVPTVVTATAGTSVANTAYVTGANTVPTSRDVLLSPTKTYSATDTDTVTSEVDLVVTKTAPVTSANSGDSIAYTLTVKNTGTRDAASTVLTDFLDAALVTFVSADSGGGLSGGNVVWSLGGLAGGGAATDTVHTTLRVNNPLPPLVGTVDNTASATAASYVSAGATHNPVSNVASVSINLPTVPDLAITNTVSSPLALPNQPFTYTITVTAPGLRSTTGVVVTDVLDPAAVFVSADNGGVYDAATHTVTWNVAGTFVGSGQETAVFHVQAFLPASTVIFRDMTNHAAVTDDHTNGADVNLANNTADVPIKAVGFLYNHFENFATYTPYDSAPGANPATGGPQEPFGRTPLPYQPAMLNVSPIYSGSADPGSSLVIEIYSAQGAMVDTQTVTSDTGGNWMANFPGAALHDYPQSVEIVEQAQGDAGTAATGFNMRTYFTPAINSSHFSGDPLSIDSVLAHTAGNIVQDMYQAARFPFGFGNVKSSYETLSAGATAAGE